jgi:hypothetical protein
MLACLCCRSTREENIVTIEPVEVKYDNLSPMDLVTIEPDGFGKSPPQLFQLAPQDPCKNRPGVIRCTVTKGPGLQLGLSVDRSFAATLKITRVRPGLVADWNEVNPEWRVEVGYHITAVNGVAGSATALLHLIKSEDTLDMKIISGSWGATPGSDGTAEVRRNMDVKANKPDVSRYVFR